MLKVLQLIPTLDRSGAEKQLVMLAAGLPRDRYAVEVAALTRLGPLATDLRAAGVPVHLVGKRFKADPLALARLTALIRRGKYDVVQTWLFAANAYGRVAARRAGVPVIVATEMAVDLWKGRAERAIDRWLGRRGDCVVGNSQAVVDYYREVGVPAEKLVVIRSGIADLPASDWDTVGTRSALGVVPEAPLLLFVGRLAEQKRVDDLLKALDLLQHVRPDLRTWIVGDGPLRSRLEDMAGSFTLRQSGRVSFLGHRDDVPRLVAAADALVLPSRYEGLPNVVLEAMQAGKPVVATAAPGTTEVVVDGQTGLLVPVGDHVALTRALRAVIDDPALARRLGDSGRSRAATEFRADAMVAAFGALYDRLAGERSSAG